MNTKKLHKYFGLIIFISIIFITSFVLLLILDISFELQLFLILLISIPTYLLVNSFHIKFEQYNYLVQNEKLFADLAPSVNISNIPFSKPFSNTLATNHYKLFDENEDLAIYYCFKFFEENRSKGRTLVLLNIIKNDEMTFNDESMMQRISSVEDKLSIDNKYSQKILYIVKSTNKESNEKIKETHYPFWIKKGREHLVMLQVYYFKTENKIYVPNNINYSPNRYYKFAIDELNLIFNAKN